MGMNQWTGEGVAIHVETKYLSSGTALVSFTLACGKKTKEKDIPLYMKCSIWGKFAEAVRERLTEKAKVTVFGELYENQWVDQDGKKRSRIECTVSRLSIHGATAVQHDEHPDGIPEHAEFVPGPDAGDIW